MFFSSSSACDCRRQRARSTLATQLLSLTLILGLVSPAQAQEIKPSGFATPSETVAPVDSASAQAEAVADSADGLAGEVEGGVVAATSSLDATAADPQTMEPSALNEAGFEQDGEQVGMDGVDMAATPAEGVPEDAAADPKLPHDLTPWGMFQQADWVVKAVMIGLAIASVVTWTVFLTKSAELRGAVKHQRRLLIKLLEARSLNEARLSTQDLKNTLMVEVTSKELQHSGDALEDGDGVKERVESLLDRLVVAQGRSITKGTGVLATIGSTAPFVGLFGTVWGIMNSFIGISEAQTTNLAVVAPGIAEALLATALGLVAAIPAVIIYNHFARQVASYKGLLGDSAAAVLRLVSRDLSRGVCPPVVAKVREA